MGRRRSADDIDGIVVIDKPAGMTSHDVVARVRRAVGQHRVGHTGTLDPAATGVLVVCLGRATRLVQFLQAGTKTYAATMVLGIETDSQDADGAVVRTVAADHIDERALCEVLTELQGEITQVPPMVSAVKVDGERLHHKARRGEVVEREPRKVTVHDLVLDRFEPGEHPTASFLVTCSSGTYVRTLAHDAGQRLGVGASLTSLRRVANEPFQLADAVSLDVIAAAAGNRAALPGRIDVADAMRRALPMCDLDDEQLVRRLVDGGRLPAAAMRALPDDVQTFMVGWRGALVGIYQRQGPAGAQGEARAQLVWMQPADLDAASARSAPATAGSDHMGDTSPHD